MMDKSLKTYNICFFGTTGFGKSSLINSLFGTKFCTDGVVSCTKELYSVTVMEQKGDAEATTVFDTPGIGEFSSNEKYEKFYQMAAQISDCIVLVLTLDRADAPSQRLVARLAKYVGNRAVKFVIALNHIDSNTVNGNNTSYSPWNEKSNKPSPRCQQDIKEREKEIHEKFDNKFRDFVVVPVCAARNYGIQNLRTEILK